MGSDCSTAAPQARLCGSSQGALEVAVLIGSRAGGMEIYKRAERLLSAKA